MFYKDGKLFTESEIRALNHNVSFGVQFSPDGYEVVFETPNPATDLQVGIQDGTEIDSKGNRVIKWTVRDKTVDELEAERKASIPSQLTPRQLRLQLLTIELLDEVEALCSTDKAMSIWFEYSLDFQRSHDMVKVMGTQLGMSESDMDNFFIEASKL